jgi:aryl-alcohol dehydrogenase-like predicted oxidoreductase
MQNQYSLTYREEEREMNAYCKFAGIGIIPWSPLNGGQLARPMDSKATSRSTSQQEMVKGTIHEHKSQEWEDEIVRRVEKIAHAKGWTMAQVSLAWINEKVTSPIVGISSVRCLAYVILLISNTNTFTGQAPRRSYYPRPQASRRRNQVS